MSRTEPIEPPAGYRWHFNTDAWSGGLGRLELIPLEAHIGSGGMLWIDEPVPGKKRKRRVRYYSRHSDAQTIDRETQIRRASIAIVRTHKQRLAEKAASAAAAARIAERIRS